MLRVYEKVIALKNCLELSQDSGPSLTRGQESQLLAKLDECFMVLERRKRRGPYERRHQTGEVAENGARSY
jgi:hypothetical protein